MKMPLGYVFRLFSVFQFQTINRVTMQKKKYSLDASPNDCLAFCKGGTALQNHTPYYLSQHVCEVSREQEH